MSIYRQPFERHDFRGGLDSGLVFYLLNKYGKGALLEQFKGGEIVRDLWYMIACEYGAGTYNYVSLEEDKDARKLEYGDSEFDTILSHPPYWTAKKYSDDPRDLSNCKTYEEFKREFGRTLDEAERVLRPGGYLIVIVGDVRRSGVLHPLHSDVIQYVKKFPNLVFRDMVIWELTATGTAMLGTKWMLMGNYCLIWEKLGHDLTKVFK